MFGGTWGVGLSLVVREMPEEEVVVTSVVVLGVIYVGLMGGIK